MSVQELGQLPRPALEPRQRARQGLGIEAAVLARVHRLRAYWPLLAVPADVRPHAQVLTVRSRAEGPSSPWQKQGSPQKLGRRVLPCRELQRRATQAVKRLALCQNLLVPWFETGILHTSADRSSSGRID